METLANEKNKSVRDIVAECNIYFKIFFYTILKISYYKGVSKVISHDYPEQWNSLLPTIINNIQSGDIVRTINTLLVLRKLAKRYEFKPRAGNTLLLQ